MTPAPTSPLPPPPGSTASDVTAAPSSVSVASSDAFFGNVVRVAPSLSVSVLGLLWGFGLGALPLASDERLQGALLLDTWLLGLSLIGVLLVRGRGVEGRLYNGLIFTSAVLVLPVVYFLDFAGPIIGTMAMFLFVYSLYAPQAWARVVVGVVLVLNVTVDLLNAAVLLPRWTLLQPVPNLETDLGLTVTTTVLYVVAYRLAYAYRRRTGEHLAELALAGREIAAREALLREARLGLERVAEIGMPGRFTEQRLGSYLLGNILGRGGMSELYDAVHVATRARAAVKLLKAPPGHGHDFYRRFQREAALVGLIDSPHVVKLLEVGGLEATLPYIAMERLEGEDLAKLLDRRTLLSPAEVLQLVREVGAGLSAAAVHNVVHRDIKPSNLFRTTEGVWKVLDFGVGRLEGDSTTLTGASLVGTLGYVAPEQVLTSGVATHQTDLHALAIVAYQALTGRRAFVEREPKRVLLELEGALPPAPTALVPELHKDVDHFFRIALAKRPSDRFTDGTSLAQAFELSLAGALPELDRRRAAALDSKLTFAAPSAPRGSSAEAPTRTSASAKLAVGAAPATPAVQGAGAAEVTRAGVVPQHLLEQAGAPPVAVVAELPRSDVTMVDAPETVARSLALARVPVVVRALMAASVFGLVQLPVNHDPQMRVFGAITSVVLFLGFAEVLRASKAQASERYHRAVAFTFLVSTALTYFFQVYGLVPAVIALGLLAYCFAAPAGHALVALACVAVPHAAMHLGVTFGFLRDRGAYVVQAGTAARLWNLAHGLGMYGLAVGLGRLVSRQSLAALSHLSAAFRTLAEREALLLDARRELERAVGIGQPGALTGQTFGSFTLGPVLGKGGMGEVYEATARDGGLAAAVKVLSRKAHDDSQHLSRFQKEMQLAQSLVSPHVVKVLEAGDGQGGGVPYLAMERLTGEDLSVLLQRRLLLPPGEVRVMVEQLAEGLAAAHALGIVHRDLKPQNVFLTTSGTWKLMDFGVAALAGAQTRWDDARTAGTPAFMAPEQLESGGVVDSRVDVHALAALAYRALTGQTAFGAKDPLTALRRVLYELPPAPSALVDVPSAVDDVLRVGLAKAPDDRFADAVSFAKALAAALEGTHDARLAAEAKRLCGVLPWASSEGSKRGGVTLGGG